MTTYSRVTWNGLTWRRSSYSSAQGNCVEIAALPSGCTAVRDSKQQSGPVLAFAPVAWQTFCSAIKAGHFGCD
jgi:Domain of unknown function (DUF397)